MSRPSFTYPLTNPSALAAKILAAGGPAIDPTKTTGSASANTALGKVTLEWLGAPGAPRAHNTNTVDSKPWDMPLGTIGEHLSLLFA
jgi:hypothetical protein